MVKGMTKGKTFVLFAVISVLQVTDISQKHLCSRKNKKKEKNMINSPTKPQISNPLMK